MCLKKVTVETCHVISKTFLYTLKFILLYHVIEYLKRFVTLTILKYSPLEHYNLRIKRSYR